MAFGASRAKLGPLYLPCTAMCSLSPEGVLCQVIINPAHSFLCEQRIETQDRLNKAGQLTKKALLRYRHSLSSFLFRTFTGGSIAIQAHLQHGFFIDCFITSIFGDFFKDSATKQRSRSSTLR